MPPAASASSGIFTHRLLALPLPLLARPPPPPQPLSTRASASRAASALAAFSASCDGLSSRGVRTAPSHAISTPSGSREPPPRPALVAVQLAQRGGAERHRLLRCVEQIEPELHAADAGVAA